MSIQDELRSFVALSAEERLPYWVDPCPATFDINLELSPPERGEINYISNSAGHLSITDGKIGVRSDDDFFINAMLPWRFHRLSVEEIGAILWSDLPLTFNNTSGCHFIEIEIP